MIDDCLICQRIASIKKNSNPYFVQELETSYVVLGDHQFYKGYTLLLFKNHETELHMLSQTDQRKLMEELVLVGRSIYNLFSPKKINYELLGNTDAHVHWHIFPRYTDDPEPKKPVWSVERAIREEASTIPNPQGLKDLKTKLLHQINLEQEKITKPQIGKP